jgi:DNA-binding NtrC family response regulator
VQTILLVEDERELAHVVSRELTGAGCAVEHAADEEAGLRRFAAGPPDPVILDRLYGVEAKCRMPMSPIPDCPDRQFSGGDLWPFAQ